MEIKSELASPPRSRQFREGGRKHWNVRIYLATENDKDIEDLDRIDRVHYKLHPTFKQRIRESSDRRNNFEIAIWTYGFFKIDATIFFKDSRTKDISGFVSWQTPEVASRS